MQCVFERKTRMIACLWHSLLKNTMESIHTKKIKYAQHSNDSKSADEFFLQEKYELKKH